MKTLVNLVKEIMKGFQRIALTGIATGCKML